MGEEKALPYSKMPIYKNIEGMQELENYYLATIAVIIQSR